ncbi:putative CmcJ-like methyltransferase [Apiosordaria backusii]|uniref:CmcJ-like methyltransferase n=1 Tax=Apiosordaria backusii TaxID=314023 RepID=A0AA40K6R0_9PEZI|nr:putative CmcJ-like methyltransferase [Apiosordaria backusii]
METRIRYMARSPILQTEKAFSTDFPVDHVDDARSTNLVADDRPVTVHAIQDPNQWELDTHGFCILRAEVHLDLDRIDTHRREVENAFWYDIEAILHEKFPRYSRIEAYDLTVRRRDLDFPQRVRQYDPSHEQPAEIAHSDTSQRGGFLVLQHCFPGQDDYWKHKDFDIINVWRPLRRPTDDWPLALCDYTTIDQENDLLLNDAIRRDTISENSLMHFNAAHKWYYLKDQGINDLLVFRNSDSGGKRARGFHAAVWNPKATGPPRESVEVRLVAFY